MRALWFPLVVLALAIPLPEFVFKLSRVQLQLLASQTAERALDLLGVSVLREGNILHLAGFDMSVAQACSGLRSLLSIAFLTITYCYFLEPKKRIRLLLVVLVVPLTILANAARLVATALLVPLDPRWALGLRHEAVGWTAAILTVGLLFGSHRVIRRHYHVSH